MRESTSDVDTKEAPVYLAVMSAEQHEPGTHVSQPLVHGEGAGSRISSQSCSSVLTGTDQDEDSRQPNSGQLAFTAAENAKSAFEITSVSAIDATEDLEQSKGMSHEADSFMEAPTKHRGQSESSESDETVKFSLGGASKSTVAAGAPQTVREQLSEPNDRGLPLDGATNGPVVAPVPRRFRRVNKYERGRWMIEDALEHREAEERPDSEMRGIYSNQNSNKGSTSGTILGRESPYSQRRKGGEGGGVGEELVQSHSRSSSDVGGQALDTVGTGDNYHGDRGSVIGGETASNLSRNTSQSSLTTAGDKSVDGDHSSERLSQLKDESESESPSLPLPPHTSAGNSTQSVAVSSPPQPPRHDEAPAVHPSTTTTSDSGGEESQSEACNKTAGVHRVQTALSHLNAELQRLVEENKEITRLKDENRHLDEKNRELQGQRRKLTDENRELTAQITSLVQRVDELTQKNEQLNSQLKKNPLTVVHGPSGDS